MLISVVKEYYENAGIVPALLNSKIGKLERHPDVLAEFVEWIKTGSYKETDYVEASVKPRQSLLSSARSIFKNKSFVTFFAGDLFSYISMAFFQTAMLYYITMLLNV